MSLAGLILARMPSSWEFGRAVAPLLLTKAGLVDNTPAVTMSHQQHGKADSENKTRDYSSCSLFLLAEMPGKKCCPVC